MTRASPGAVPLFLVLGLVAAGCGGSTGATTTTAATTTAVTDTTVVSTTRPSTTTNPPTTTTQPGAQEGTDSDIDLALDAIAAWNTSDFDAFLAFFDEESRMWFRPAYADDVRDNMEFHMGLGDVVAVDECERTSDVHIVCHGVGSDGLSGPLGVVEEADWVFRTSNGRITDFALEYTGSRPKNHYISLMGGWLEDAHPDVWQVFAATDGCTSGLNCFAVVGWRANAEAAAVLLEYSSEYLAYCAEAPTIDFNCPLRPESTDG